jgi:putative RecB family exonuclease
LPATLGVVYLGNAGKGGDAEPVIFNFQESEAEVVETFVGQFLSQYALGNAKPHISDHCAFCPYGRWCNRTLKNVETNDALHELWKLQERAGLIQKQLAPGFGEGIHLTEDFIVEKKGSFYLKVRRKSNGS